MMYRKLFGFHKWESVRCCIDGVGRMDFEHIYFWLRIKFLKGNLLCNNKVTTSIMDCYMLSHEFAKLCFTCCIELDAAFYVLKLSVREKVKDTCL